MSLCNWIVKQHRVVEEQLQHVVLDIALEAEIGSYGSRSSIQKLLEHKIYSKILDKNAKFC